MCHVTRIFLNAETSMRAKTLIALASAAAAAALLIARRSRPLARHLRWVQAAGVTHSNELQVAIELALRCGEAMLATAGAPPTLKDGEEDGIDPVTATDTANEALVTQTLAMRFPSHSVIGEEAAAAAGGVPPIGDGPTWIVDPIDGTQNFVHGLPMSVVSIGLARGGVPVLGVVYDPYRDELFVGVVGEGAFLNGRRMRVDGCESLQRAMVLTDVGYERSDAGVARISSALAAVLGANTFGVRIVGSTVLALVWVAAGRASAFYAGLGKRDCPKPWDWCAAHAIAIASGASFLRLGGSDAPFDIRSNSCVCAASPQLAHRLAELLVRK